MKEILCASPHGFLDVEEWIIVHCRFSYRKCPSSSRGWCIMCPRTGRLKLVWPLQPTCKVACLSREYPRVMFLVKAVGLGNEIPLALWTWLFELLFLTSLNVFDSLTTPTPQCFCSIHNVELSYSLSGRVIEGSTFLRPRRMGQLVPHIHCLDLTRSLRQLWKGKMWRVLMTGSSEWIEAKVKQWTCQVWMLKTFVAWKKHERKYMKCEKLFFFFAEIFFPVALWKLHKRVNWSHLIETLPITLWYSYDVR